MRLRARPEAREAKKRTPRCRVRCTRSA